MTAPIITDLPTAPLVTDNPKTFDTNAFPFVASLNNLVTELNALTSYLNTYSSGNAINPSVTGDINFTGTANRIKADFDNATESLRAMFQTANSFEKTTVGLIPSFGGTESSVKLYNTDTPNNASFLEVGSAEFENYLLAGKNGTGSYLPLNMYAAGQNGLQLSDTDGKLKAPLGMRFPNSNVSGSDVLDWYEEGTFVPSVAGSTSAGTATYNSIRTGNYTIVGNRVHGNLAVGWTAHTGTGFIEISGLPFVVAKGTIASVYFDTMTVGSGYHLVCSISSTGTKLYLYICDYAGGSSARLNLDATVNQLAINFSYEV